MVDVTDYDFVIYTGEPQYHYTRSTGPRRNDKLIQNILKLEVGQFIHFPTERNTEQEKKAKEKIKSTVDYVHRHYKPKKFRTGAALHSGVWGVTIERKEDIVNNNNLPV